MPSVDGISSRGCSVAVRMLDWSDRRAVLALPIAAEWAKPFRERVAAAKFHKRIKEEATLATIEALTRKLRSRGWRRRHSSKRRRDGHADSRYYRPPHANVEVRISSHSHPGSYRGMQIVITPDMVTGYDVLGLIHMIEQRLKNEPRWRSDG